ncbi:centriole, cilia and spindle-associated protein [Ochotona curzoniae]|uniref:centriole, cilia and spindle-associated protein n=1 Tax=Ochotona curzoniae TaxID=130825 RepID=UPI001B349438|nr:centriole, cilia and spindle-associated protein [Ochotona curzoniae]
MSPGSGVKSEYMKRYQEPRWDEYGPCYRELLHYRLGRRLLEQAHAPWLWDDWAPAGGSDDSASSASSGAGRPAPPAPRCAPASPPPPAQSGAREEPARRAREAPEEPGAEAGCAEAVEAEDAAVPALPAKDVEEKPEQQTKTKETDKLPTSVVPRQQPSALFARGNRKAAKSPQRSSKIKENRHPFALYGWGEKQMDTGSQKTHNVCASAPVHEIHESALRAKNRRQVEKRRLVAQRQRAHSVDVEKNCKVKPASSENPWMTEYMRCYSARA